MAFSKGKLIRVRDMAQRVAHKADELISALDNRTQYSRDSGSWREERMYPNGAPMDANFITGTRASGEFRRLTMELTRLLADVRKP